MDKNQNPLHAFIAGILIGLAITIIAVIFALLPSCNAPKSPKTSLALVGHDRTEQMTAHPDAASLLPFLSLDEDPNQGAEIDFFDVTDVSLNKYVTFSLAAEKGSLANPFTRKRQIAKFKSDIDNYLDTAAHDTVGHDRSSVYHPMVSALTELAQSTATDRTLILYSDLAENENDISFYRPGTLALLRSDPDRIAAELAAKAPLPDDLSGIRVYFIYQPSNPQSDALFQTVSSFYKSLLEKRNATVVIEGNLRK